MNNELLTCPNCNSIKMIVDLYTSTLMCSVCFTKSTVISERLSGKTKNWEDKPDFRTVVELTRKYYGDLNDDSVSKES